MSNPNDEPIADVSRAATAPNDEVVADPTPIPQTGTGDPGGLSTVPLSAEDLDPNDELLVESPIDDDPAGDSSMG
jgi:hypothetical protein